MENGLDCVLKIEKIAVLNLKYIKFEIKWISLYPNVFSSVKTTLLRQKSASRSRNNWANSNLLAACWLVMNNFLAARLGGRPIFFNIRIMVESLMWTRSQLSTNILKIYKILMDIGKEINKKIYYKRANIFTCNFPCSCYWLLSHTINYSGVIYSCCGAFPTRPHFSFHVILISESLLPQSNCSSTATDLSRDGWYTKAHVRKGNYRSFVCIF